MSRPLRILIADDHSMVRSALRCMIERDDELTILAEAGDGREAVRVALEFDPDIVLMDCDMPELSGIEATRQLTRQRPDLPVVALSGYRDADTVQQMLDAGAQGYVSKLSPPEELATALKSVARGERYLSPHVSP